MSILIGVEAELPGDEDEVDDVRRGVKKGAFLKNSFYNLKIALIASNKVIKSNIDGKLAIGAIWGVSRL